MPATRLHPNIIENVIAKPPNLELPEVTPCLLFGSLPKFNSDRMNNIVSAIKPFMPVIMIIRK